MSKKRLVMWIFIALFLIGLMAYLSFFVYIKRPLTVRPFPGPGVPPEKLFLDYNKTHEDIPIKGIPWQDAQ